MAKKARGRRRQQRKLQQTTTRGAGRRTTAARTLTQAAIAEPIQLKDEEIERALATGENSGTLQDFFGPAQYAELRRLAQDAAARGVRRGGDRVIILPGVMGSKLGFDGIGPFDDVIWANPVAFVAGRIAELELKGVSKVEALGVILFAYLKLKLKLQINGHDAEFFAYDWRLSMNQVGKALASDINAGGRKTHLVAHSMGGLAARAALAHKPKHLGRVIMLGTPNFGSFSPIQAFRGADTLLQKIDFIDPLHDAADLAAILGTFPGLCEMMPSPKKYPVDFFKTASWPPSGPHPAQAILAAALKVQDQLPTNFDDLVIIAGVDQQTVVDAKIVGGEFVYTQSSAGDGTVPLDCVLLPGARKTYYVAESHGSLPNNNDVESAVDSILQTGETKNLPDQYQPQRAVRMSEIRERALRAPPYDGNPGRALSAEEKRKLVEEVAAPDKTSAGAPLDTLATPAALAAGAIGRPIAESVVVGRQRQQRLDVTLAFGSITEVEADAYALGVFNLVAPGGAASAIDARMDGAIQQMFERRMFNAGVGEISILPTGRHPVRADVIAFAGLGPFDSFNENVLEIVGENLVRTFINTRVDEFATVPIGGATNAFSAEALRRLLVGFLRGLQDSGLNSRFRGVTICETDKDRYAAICNEFYRLCGTQLFDGVEVTLRQTTLPEPAPVTTRAATVTGKTQNTFLIVRQESDEKADPIDFGCSILTAGAKATVFRARQSVKRKELDDHLKQLGQDDVLTPRGLRPFGEKLAELVLPDSIRKILERELDRPLVVVHDAPTSRIPWETLQLGNKFPALDCGLSHRYEAENLSIAKWLESRQRSKSLDILLIVDPTEDLDGARAEGERINQLLQKMKPAVTVTQLLQHEARKDTILRHFSSAKYDAVHYAGHAFFDPSDRARSGILCAGREVLSGADLANIGGLPSFVFFNACESGRLRRGATRTQIDDKMHPIDRVQRGVGFAEAFLRGGVANYLGTYWPVNDNAALKFSETFYTEVLGGKSLGAAIMAGRKAVENIGSADWADYILYGNTDFVLKLQ
jgi:CHAT domain-containing protein/pimeloyl-ACP methyl ester carboxylesterase